MQGVHLDAARRCTIEAFPTSDTPNENTNVELAGIEPMLVSPVKRRRGCDVGRLICPVAEIKPLFVTVNVRVLTVPVSSVGRSMYDGSIWEMKCCVLDDEHKGRFF